MNRMEILAWVLVVSGLYGGTCANADDGKALDNYGKLNLKRGGDVGSLESPPNRKLFLSFLGSIFKPIVRGISNLVDPPPPPPPPPQPQYIFHPGLNPAQATQTPPPETVPTNTPTPTPAPKTEPATTPAAAAEPSLPAKLAEEAKSENATITAKKDGDDEDEDEDEDHDHDDDEED